jgi:hypothetical protein
MYIHGPDRTTPFAETLEAVDKEYRAGKFEKLGRAERLSGPLQCDYPRRGEGFVSGTEEIRHQFLCFYVS